MAKVDDGGQAFPDWETGKGGMSLRDWFAGQALMGMCVDPESYPQEEQAWKYAQRAYALADAFLAERAKRRHSVGANTDANTRSYNDKEDQDREG